MKRACLWMAAATACLAWSPPFHQAQTRLARRMVPKGMARLLAAHEAALMEGARGVGSDQPPTVEDVEDQFRRIVAMSELKKRPEVLVKELGVLARMVQLLSDPSVSVGLSPLRSTFERYADERFKDLVVTREPYWALDGSLDPRPRMVALVDAKFARHRRLLECVDPDSGRRIGPWDTLSIPFGQLQLGFSSGVNATANVWTLLWRDVGDLWEAPASRD